MELQLEIKFEGRTYFIPTKKINGVLWFHFNGKTFAVEKNVETAEKSKAPGQASNIKAPMPGKIIKIFAQSKMRVLERQPIIVMEAMKMEYTLESTGPGIIEFISCKVGDQVQIGQTLAVIKPI